MSNPAGPVVIVGCGWLGVPLAVALMRRGFAVAGTTTDPARLEQLRALGVRAAVVVLGGEQPHLDALTELLAGAEAVVVSVPPRRRRPDVETAHPAELRPLMQAIRIAAPRHLVFTSSTSVYGDGQGDVEETSPLAPDTASGQALMHVESMIREVFDHPGAPHATIVRLGGLVGPGRHPGRFFAGAVPPTVAGDAPVNLLHLDDAVAVLAMLLAMGRDAPAVVNAAAPRHPTRAEFYGAIAAQAGHAQPCFPPGDGSANKRVHPAALLALGYKFLHPDPLAMQFG